MRRGTTPTRKRTYPKLLIFAEVAFWQDEIKFVVTPDIEATETGCLVSFTLTQEQTLSLDVGHVFWQIRALCDDGAVASEAYLEIVEDVHPEGVISQPVGLGFARPDEEEEETPEEEPEETPEEEPEETPEEEPEEAPEEEPEETTEEEPEETTEEEENVLTENP